jgi:hypothetical protein
MFCSIKISLSFIKNVVYLVHALFIMINDQKSIYVTFLYCFETPVIN